MRDQIDQKQSHVIIIPFPGQGHINPMSEFSKRLAFKGLNLTFLLLSNKPSKPYKQNSTTIITISNGVQEGEDPFQDLNLYMKNIETSLKNYLPQLIKELKLSGDSPKAIVYDSAMPWLLDVAHGFGLLGATFFTQPWLVNVIYYHVFNGSFSVPDLRYDHKILASFPSFPMMKLEDLPSFLSDSVADMSRVKLVTDQLSNIERVDVVLCNSFDKLEEKVLKWFQTIRPIMNIGPTIPSIYLDKQYPKDKDYDFNLFNTKKVNESLQWLNSKQPNSVIYISLGSLVSLNKDQMTELAESLRQINHNFLWVVRETEINKLPINYIEEVKEKGLIVTWSSQLEVLEHISTGCFITHCGWNSTLEGLSLGVPMIGMPYLSDQPTNAKFMEDVWKIGVRVKVDENGLVKREEILRCVREVMEEEKGEEIRRNVEKWKRLAQEAFFNGGSSHKNIDVFVDMCRM